MNTVEDALDRTLETLTRRLLESRNRDGYWEGHLASSALSTATAVIALRLAEKSTRADYHTLISLGIGWLIANQNQDGGWGDTVRSASNLSTTALCWSALSLDRQAGGKECAAVERTEHWLRAEVGQLSPARLKQAIIRRYGKDRTFSVPILTALALGGRLGSATDSWRLVPQLPFELAACPHQWFRWLQLPVVSYALPALVAIGQVRHHHAPTRNPLLRRIRSALRTRTLNRAREMQPASGGYLEAMPLTAFVAMSLIAADQASHPIVEHGIRFLVASARPDGSWPIDTNLATWVTTLAVNALGPREVLSDDDRQPIVRWLLAQQPQREHPFTHTPPGGWAWTNLTGGVPDADDTAGALRAIGNMAGSEPQVRAAAAAGVNWLLALQNRDGGIPTFCRGWGALPFDRSAPDLTAHALQAWSVWYPAVVPEVQQRIVEAARRAMVYLANCQSADGSWRPLWFGNERADHEANFTYGTSSTVAALTCDLARGSADAERCVRRGIGWLISAQNSDGGWGGAAAGTPSSIEETGVALHALASTAAREISGELADALSRGARWLMAATDEGRRTPASPIGLYFARLWYFEEMYPLIFALLGLFGVDAVLRSGHTGSLTHAGVTLPSTRRSS